MTATAVPLDELKQYEHPERVLAARVLALANLHLQGRLTRAEMQQRIADEVLTNRERRRA